jgi:hypothetical protein
MDSYLAPYRAASPVVRRRHWLNNRKFNPALFAHPADGDSSALTQRGLRSHGGKSSLPAHSKYAGKTDIDNSFETIRPHTLNNGAKNRRTVQEIGHPPEKRREVLHKEGYNTHEQALLRKM